MGIKLEHICYKKNDVIIFNDLNLTIPYNKIVGIYGDKLDNFIDLVTKKEFNTGKIIDDDYFLNKVNLIDNYDDFITNYVKDELYIKLNGNDDLENQIIDILEKFDLDKYFLERTIDSLSNFENKLLSLIITMYDENKIIIYKDLFNGIDYHNKSLFVRMLKNIRKNYKKVIFIYDKDMDIINNLVDYLLIIDSKLIDINRIDDIFENDEIKNIDIEIPNFIKLKKLLAKKNIDIKNINDLLRK